MCFSNSFIEQQANKITEEIRKVSFYKFVRVEYMANESIGVQKQNEHSTVNVNSGNGVGLISKVILEDQDGTLYSVEPNMNGLRFAKGEISFNKYRKLQRRNDLNMFICFFMIIGFFGAAMFIMGKLI